MRSCFTTEHNGKYLICFITIEGIIMSHCHARCYSYRQFSGCIYNIVPHHIITIEGIIMSHCHARCYRYRQFSGCIYNIVPHHIIEQITYPNVLTTYIVSVRVLLVEIFIW